MPPWKQIQFKHQQLNVPLEKLAEEHGISKAELEYAAQQWSSDSCPSTPPGQSFDEKAAIDALAPEYIELEFELVAKIRAILACISPEDPNCHLQVKVLTESFKALRYGGNEDKNSNISIQVLNSFDKDDCSSYERVRNVITPTIATKDLDGSRRQALPPVHGKVVGDA